MEPLRSWLRVSIVASVAWHAGCSADNAGCTKDTDCAAGRICGADGRCADADDDQGATTGSPTSTSSGGGGAAACNDLEVLERRGIIAQL